MPLPFEPGTYKLPAKKKTTPTPRSAATQSPPESWIAQNVFQNSPASKATLLPGTVTAPKTMGTIASPLGPQLPGYTAAQSAYIMAQVQAAQLLEQQKIDAAQKLQAENTAKAQAALQGYYGALAPMLSKIAPAVQAGYTQEAGLDALLGKGFGGTFAANDAAMNQQNQAAMQQTGGTMEAINNSPVAQALGWIGGGLPAAGANAVGPVAGAAAEKLPAWLTAMGGEQEGALARAQIAADQQYGQQRADLAAQIPGLILKFGAEAVDQALKAQTAQGSSIFGSATGGYYRINPKTNQPELVVGGTGPATTATKYQIFGDSKSGYRTIVNGKVVQLTNPVASTAGGYHYHGSDGYWYERSPDGSITRLPGGLAKGKIQNITTKNGGLMAYDPDANTYTWINKPTITPGKPDYYDDPQTGRKIMITTAADGTVTQQAISGGWHTDANGNKTYTDVNGRQTFDKKKPTGSVTTQRGFSNDFVKATQGDIAKWFRGTPAIASRPGSGIDPKPYRVALQDAIDRIDNNKAWVKKATQLVNAKYGTPQMIAMANAKKAKDDLGESLVGAIELILEAETAGTLDLYPLDYVNALAKTYNWTPAAVTKMMKIYMSASG